MNGLDVFEYRGEGYMPQLAFGAWRVAYLNYAPRFTKEGCTYLERHMETDEVFVLLKGTATLYIGLDNPAPVELEQGKIYNVRRTVWHAVTCSPDASVLIVENEDTSRENSEYHDLVAPLP